ncbi:MAG TPA: CbtA family protein [Nitrosopumilaceae archaeon]|nr:CbtA family protein [Nitrosopumilaceae archaeon]
MKTPLFLAIVLLSGFSAGIIHGFTNLALVEPYLDEAIGIENQNLFETGDAMDSPSFWVEYNSYRDWQKNGQILAGGILGMSIGSLFGIVFAFSRKVLPEGHDAKKALVLATIMWFTIFFIPFLKYPANPPTVGDSDTVVLRGILYLIFIAISGLSALGFYHISKKLKKQKKILSIIGYAIFMSLVFIFMPSNPDVMTAPISLVDGFRLMSLLAVSVFWISNALILGILWNRFKPDSSIPTKIH